MDHVAFDALTRRTSLLTIGAALADHVTTDAKKKRRKKKGNKGDVFKLCKKQVDQCLDFFLEELCEEDNLECQALVETCCPEMGQCEFSGFFVCLIDSGGMSSTNSISRIVGPESTP